MAEGGYDPETTNPFNPHGDDYDDDRETTGLLDREKEEDERKRMQEKHGPLGERYEMKHQKYWWEKKGHKFPDIPTTTKTSTSDKQETSFIDTPSGGPIFVTREQATGVLEKDILEVFPNIDEKLIPFIRRDEYNRLILKLGKSNSRDWVIAFDGRPSHDVGLSKFPSGLRGRLGKTNEQINQENYEKQEGKEEKQAEIVQEQKEARRREKESEEKLTDANERLINLYNSLAVQERAKNSVETPEEAESKEESINVIKRSIKSVEGEVKEFTRESEESRNARENADARVEEGERQVETARERVNERLLSLRDRIKEIFKKHGFTVIAVATAIATVIGVIVNNLKAGLTKVAKGLGNGLKELGKKLGEILPGMIGAIASFIFRTAGEVIGFLAKNAWLLVVGLLVLAVEQFKKKSK